MTTGFILLLGIGCIAGHAVLELVMWLLEAIFATAKYLICWLCNRPSSWKQNYLEIRIIFTWLLKWVSFAELTPTQSYKHRHSIHNYLKTLMTRRNVRRSKRRQRDKRMFNKLPGNRQERKENKHD